MMSQHQHHQSQHQHQLQQQQQQRSEQDFNLSWVFSQLTAIGAGGGGGKNDASGSNDPTHAPPSLPKKSSLSSSSSPLHSTTILTPLHLRHIFTFLRLNTISQEECEEVLNMLDDNNDGRVTVEDFVESMRGGSGMGGGGSIDINNPSTFDTRYSLNLPFSSLDASTRDGILTEEDYRYARTHLGKVFGCDNDTEIRECMRAAMNKLAVQVQSQANTQGGQSTDSPLAVPASSSSSLFSSTLSSSAQRRGPVSLEKDAFRAIIGCPPRVLTASGGEKASNSPGTSPHTSPGIETRRLSTSDSEQQQEDELFRQHPSQRKSKDDQITISLTSDTPLTSRPPYHTREPSSVLRAAGTNMLTPPQSNTHSRTHSSSSSNVSTPSHRSAVSITAATAPGFARMNSGTSGRAASGRGAIVGRR